VFCSSQDHLKTGTHDLDHLVLAGAKNADNSGRKEYVNSIKNYWSWHTLILYGKPLQFFVVEKSFKKLPWKLHFRE
jgi:hypothetical protein